MECCVSKQRTRCIILAPFTLMLRAFGSAYMNDPKTIGSLTLFRSTGDVIATYDVWTNEWKEAGAINA